MLLMPLQATRSHDRMPADCQSRMLPKKLCPVVSLSSVWWPIRVARLVLCFNSLNSSKFLPCKPADDFNSKRREERLQNEGSFLFFIIFLLLSCFLLTKSYVEQRSNVGCASTIKINTIIFCIVFSFHYLCTIIN